MSKNFVIVDGSSLIHREYYSSLPEELRGIRNEEDREKEYWRLNKSEGHYINAIDGFIAELIALKYFQKADYIAVCFDENRETTFRRQIFPDYKAQRDPSPAPLKDQSEYVVDICRELGIPVFLSPEFEADDYAGSIAKQFASEDIHVSLMTTDRDYFQLVNENTDVFWMCNNRLKYNAAVEEYGKKGAPIGCIRCDKFVVKKEIGIWPDQITDWKGIAGDPSDNIPGIKGVADKAAIPLLNKYNHLERIIDIVEDTDENELKAIWKTEFGFNRSPVSAIKAGVESARFCKELATIKTDIDVPKDISYYAYNLDVDQILDLSDHLGLQKPMDVLIRIAQKDMDLDSSFTQGEDKVTNIDTETENISHEEDDMDLEEDFYAFGEY